MINPSRIDDSDTAFTDREDRSQDELAIVMGSAALLLMVGYVAGSGQWNLLRRFGTQLVSGIGTIALDRLGANLKDHL